MSTTTRAPGYVVCESHPAYRKHIRGMAAPDDVQPHGWGPSAPRTALCGATIEYGWDTLLPLPQGTFTADWWDAPNQGDRPCATCCTLYRAAL